MGLKTRLRTRLRARLRTEGFGLGGAGLGSGFRFAGKKILPALNGVALFTDRKLVHEHQIGYKFLVPDAYHHFVKFVAMNQHIALEAGLQHQLKFS